MGNGGADVLSKDQALLWPWGDVVEPSQSPQGGYMSCQLGVCTFKETDSASLGVPHHLALGEVFSKGAGTYCSAEMKTLCSSHKALGKIVFIFLPH